MLSEKAVDVSSDLDPGMAQIGQMTLEELATFQSKTLTEIIAGKVTPKQARSIDRAIRERLKVIEEHCDAHSSGRRPAAPSNITVTVRPMPSILGTNIGVRNYL